MNEDVWVMHDAEEREAVRGMDPRPHYELNDGTCVSCAAAWPCFEETDNGGWRPLGYRAESKKG